jgi:hypothetical protein
MSGMYENSVIVSVHLSPGLHLIFSPNFHIFFFSIAWSAIIGEAIQSEHIYYTVDYF